MTAVRLIFVPGLKPKPPPEEFRRELLRVLESALARFKPDAARVLAAHRDAFRLVAWNDLFYGMHRDIRLDLDGIERLIAQPAPSEEDLREIAALVGRFGHVSHKVGDAVPLLRRFIAQPGMRIMLHEADRYLRNRDGIAERIRAILRGELERAWGAGARVLVIAHSFGSVIAYDTLWDLSHGPAARPADAVDELLTLGSPLATKFIRRSLRGAARRGPERYPINIRHWVNCAAKGDVTALYPKLAPYFGEMVALGLTAAIDDFVDLNNHFRGHIGLNVHESYGYLANPFVASAIGDWLGAAP